MTATQQFIEDAIKGGWEREASHEQLYIIETDHVPFSDTKLGMKENISAILLDPLAWQAVGKTRGWKLGEVDLLKNEPEWYWKLHRFIDHLADGKSIEEALQALEANTESV